MLETRELMCWFNSCSEIRLYISGYDNKTTRLRRSSRVASRAISTNPLVFSRNRFCFSRLSRLACSNFSCSVASRGRAGRPIFITKAGGGMCVCWYVGICCEVCICCTAALCARGAPPLFIPNAGGGMWGCCGVGICCIG